MVQTKDRQEKGKVLNTDGRREDSRAMIGGDILGYLFHKNPPQVSSWQAATLTRSVTQTHSYHRVHPIQTHREQSGCFDTPASPCASCDQSTLPPAIVLGNAGREEMWRDVV